MTKVFVSQIAANHELVEKDKIIELDDFNKDEKGQFHPINLNALKSKKFILAGQSIYSLSADAYKEYLASSHRKTVYITVIDENGDIVCDEVAFSMDKDGNVYHQNGKKLAKHSVNVSEIPADGYTINGGYAYSLKPGNYAEYIKWRDTETKKEKNLLEEVLQVASDMLAKQGTCDKTEISLEDAMKRIEALEEAVYGDNDDEEITEIDAVEDFLTDNDFVSAILLGVNKNGEVCEFRFGVRQ
jgi:stalled ribosome rescue protein Dom34